MKPTIARVTLALFLLFSLTRCEKDDAALGKAAETEQDAKTTIKTISGADVPHILDYIDAVAGKDGRVELYPNPQDDTRSQEDLLVGDIISDKIVVTDRSGLSNYTMKVEKLNSGGTFSVVNYIIKETSWGQYSYYMEYVPDFDWLSNDESNLDIEHFVGTITIYNSDGIFINEFYIANGKNFGRSELIDPCPDDGDGSGGGGNNDGEDPNPDTGDTGDSGDGDSGNCNTCPDPDEQDPCSWQLNVIDECVDHDPGGTCGGNTTEVVFVCEGFDNDRSVNTGDLLRTVCGPAPDECYDNQGDPCQFGCNGGECLPDPDDENPDVGVLFDLSIIADLNSLLDTPLTPDQVSWIFESDENYGFAQEVLDALLDGIDIGLVSLNDYDFTEESPEILAFEQDYRNDMSQTEISIFDNLSRFHQLDYLHSGYLAREYAKSYFEDTVEVQYNGKGDAYRHALWNALGSAKLGEVLMQQLTDAHEERPFEYPYHYKEKQMDLFNNQVGLNIGSQSSFILMMKVKFATDRGELRYLSNTIPQATSNSQLTPTDQ